MVGPLQAHNCSLHVTKMWDLPSSPGVPPKHCPAPLKTPKASTRGWPGNCHSQRGPKKVWLNVMFSPGRMKTKEIWLMNGLLLVICYFYWFINCNRSTCYRQALVMQRACLSLPVKLAGAQGGSEGSPLPLLSPTVEAHSRPYRPSAPGDVEAGWVCRKVLGGPAGCHSRAGEGVWNWGVFHSQAQIHLQREDALRAWAQPLTNLNVLDCISKYKINITSPH